MRIMKPKIFINIDELDERKLISIERAARMCYKSEDKMRETWSEIFIKDILRRGHESVIEHEKVTVTFVVDRGVSHEIVRHRIASYSQESTRYCNYRANKYGSEITVIEPFFYKNNEKLYKDWYKACETSEKCYMNLINDGSTPQEARSVLPNSLKTEIVVTFNFREWRHFFKLRCSKNAHPQMKQVTIPLLIYFNRKFPVLFEDISYDSGFAPEHYAEIVEL